MFTLTQCGIYEIFPSPLLKKFFVKSTFLRIDHGLSWFHEFFSSESKFRFFPHCGLISTYSLGPKRPLEASKGFHSCWHCLRQPCVRGQERNRRKIQGELLRPLIRLREGFGRLPHLGVPTGKKKFHFLKKRRHVILRPKIKVHF